VGADGTLELRVPTKLSETDVDVTIMLQPVQAWPEGYFERTFGSLRDNPITLDRPRDFEVRAELR
jgi:hypothetical protein